MGHRPEKIVRYTVEQNGGEYVTGVPDLLELFERQQLTDSARREIRDALLGQGVAAEPDLMTIERSDEVRLMLVESQPAAAAQTPSVPPRARVAASGMRRLRPRTWKGWTVYGVAALFIIAALAGDPEQAEDSVPVAEPAEAEDIARETEGQASAREDQRALRRERERLRKERVRLRRERAQARREQERIRKARAAAGRERERIRRARAEARREAARQEQLEAQAVPPPEPAASCHPSYDPCLDPNASDYDCEGGSGDGPMYTGFVTVKGPDDYDLDSDGDGTGCE